MDEIFNDLAPMQGKIFKRPLHLVLICDASGRMAGESIQALNRIIRHMIPLMKSEGEYNPRLQLLMGVISFSDVARWEIHLTPIEEFQWIDLSAGGVADLGAGFRLLAKEMETWTRKMLPPVLILISAGFPTDDFKGGLEVLKQAPWFSKSLKFAIAIGPEVDETTLQKFLGSDERRVIRAKTASEAIVEAAREPTFMLLRYCLFDGSYIINEHIPRSEDQSNPQTFQAKDFDQNDSVW